MQTTCKQQNTQKPLLKQERTLKNVLPLQGGDRAAWSAYFIVYIVIIITLIVIINTMWRNGETCSLIRLVFQNVHYSVNKCFQDFPGVSVISTLLLTLLTAVIN